MVDQIIELLIPIGFGFITGWTLALAFAAITTRPLKITRGEGRQNR